MSAYTILNSHHIGDSHIKNNLSCEDYSISFSNEKMSFIAISDGHGDKNCFRSAEGAKLACESALYCCENTLIQDAIFVDEEIDIILSKLEKDIVDKWIEGVKEHYNTNPFSDEEISQAAEQAQEQYRLGKRIEKAYGCTLIMAVVTANYWIGLQVGDGKCVSAYKNGVFVEPIPADNDNCCGNRSSSMCNSNAVELFRHYYSEVIPEGIFVMSDGVEESFDQAGLFNCLYSLGYWMKNESREEAAEKLDELLPQISVGGSGDDVSVAALVSTTNEIAKPRQSLEQVYEKVNACQNVLDACNTKFLNENDKLSAANNAHKVLESKIEKLEKEIREMEKELNETLTLFEESNENIELLEVGIKDLSADVEKARSQMDVAERFKSTAEEYWFPELDKLGINYPKIEEKIEEDIIEEEHVEEECKKDELVIDSVENEGLESDNNGESNISESNTIESTQKKSFFEKIRDNFSITEN